MYAPGNKSIYPSIGITTEKTQKFTIFCPDNQEPSIPALYTIGLDHVVMELDCM